MTDFKELREALDRHASITDPARLGEVAHIQYCRDAGVIQSWCRVDRLRVLLDRLEAAERDAERYRWLLENYARGDGYDNIDEALNDGSADEKLSAAIDAMKEQQP